MTTRQTNYELLKDAYAIIDGIPYQNVDLEYFYKGSTTLNNIGCDTIACAAGWLSLHPEFQKIGLTPSETFMPKFKGSIGFSALMNLFKISYSETTNLFSDKYNPGKYDYFQTNSMNDKQLFLHRVRCFLREKGQL